MKKIATEMMFCVALDELNYAVTGHTGSFYGAFLSSIELEFTVCFFPIEQHSVFIVCHITRVARSA